MFFEIGVLKNFAILRGKHLCWSVLNKAAGLQISFEYREFVRTAFFIKHLRWLLLKNP